jgi:SagB-type dehydrogenase family enzyme
VSSASKTYPSAFGIYPVRVYLLVGAVEGINPGIYQYVQAGHGLKMLKEGDHRKESIEGSTYARFIAQAPATVVLAADFAAMTAAFGERGRSLYLPVEVGHLSQTLRLTATAVGLSVGIVGAFDPARIKDLFGISEEPLLFLPLGYPLSDR